MPRLPRVTSTARARVRSSSARPHVSSTRLLSPMRTPKIDLKMHWHRNFQRDPKSRWLREVVASLFTDELDEWRV